MLNNIETIKSILTFDNNEVYQLMILARKKEQDSPENHQSARIVRYYYVTSFEYLEKKLPTIINLCETEKARAYIEINGRDVTNIGKEINFLSALWLKDGNHGWKSIYDKAFANLPVIGDKKWIVDIDNDKEVNEKDVKLHIEGCKPYGMLKVLHRVETPNGIHLITRPYDLHESAVLNNTLHFKIDVKKCNPTLLYYPKSLVK